MCCAVAAGSVLDSGGVWQMPLPSANSTSRLSTTGTPDRWRVSKNAPVSPASGPGPGGAAELVEGEAGSAGSEVTTGPEAGGRCRRLSRCVPNRRACRGGLRVRQVDRQQAGQEAPGEQNQGADDEETRRATRGPMAATGISHEYTL